jgi:SAM-dependent methyltransferase
MHRHVCGIINTELADGAPSPVRILDIGCGDGHLIAFLQRQLTRLRPGIFLEIHGYDVEDSAVQAPAFFDQAIAFLSAQSPDIDWRGRLSHIRTTDDLPYPDDFFDFVVSNQVMEHVHDHDALFGQIRRVLKPTGLSAHVFPLKCVFYETHLKLPFVHWISNRDFLVAYIKSCNRIGIGKFRQHRRTDGRVSLTEYAEKHADYMIYETAYRSMGEIYRCAKRHRLRCSFRHTAELYFNKARSMVGAPIRYEFFRTRPALIEWCLLLGCSLLASVTLVLEKENRYVR